MGKLLFSNPQVLLNNVSAPATSLGLQIWNAHKTSVFVTFGAGISAGDVIIETGPSANYSGTWSLEGEIVATAPGYSVITIDGPREYVRARAITVTGGNLLVRVQSEGEF